MELMMKTAAKRSDGSISRAELYEFLRDFWKSIINTFENTSWNDTKKTAFFVWCVFTLPVVQDIVLSRTRDLKFILFVRALWLRFGELWPTLLCSKIILSQRKIYFFLCEMPRKIGPGCKTVHNNRIISACFGMLLGWWLRFFLFLDEVGCISLPSIFDFMWTVWSWARHLISIVLNSIKIC